MWLQNAGLAGGLGRPELALNAQSYSVSGGQPPIIPPGGPASWLDYATTPRQGQLSLSLLELVGVILLGFFVWTYGVQK